MLTTRKTLTFGILLALLMVFLFTGTVSADDGSATDPTTPEIQAAATTDDQTVVEDTSSTSVIERDSGDSVVDGDPYYRVGTTYYRFAEDCSGIDNCTNSSTPIQAAVDSIATNGTPSDRTLYIEGGDYNDYVDVDGSKIGVAGLTSMIGLGGSTDDVKLNMISVHNMAAGFSIRRMSVINYSGDETVGILVYGNAGTITLTDVNVTASGADSLGISIINYGSVIFNRVDASNNGYTGAFIQLIGPGTISITNSSFDYNIKNYEDGYQTFDDINDYRASLLINTQCNTSSVTLNGVTAYYNNGNGIYILGCDSPVTVKNTEIDFSGARLDGDYTTLASTVDGFGDGLYVFGYTVTLENIFTEFNGMNGIEVDATGSITASGLDSSLNLEGGILLNTCNFYDPDGALTCAYGTGAVTLKHAVSGGNKLDGIHIDANGTVTVSDATVGGNQYGLYIDNTSSDSASPVTLVQVNADSNNSDGVYVNTLGNVTGTNVVSLNNIGDGLSVNSKGTGGVVFKIDSSDPDDFNETSYNYGNGYSITANGPVSLISFNSMDNAGFGGSIDNTSAANSAVVLTVVDKGNTTSEITGNGGDGLNIITNGAVTIINIGASENQGNGLYISNIPASGTAKPAVILLNGSFDDNCKRDDSGNCVVSETGTYNGLEILSLGVITVTHISASGNYGYGALLENDYATATAGVFVTAIIGNGNSFNSNAEYGITIDTNGPVTIVNVNANGNGGYGLGVNNLGGTAAVTIKQFGDWYDSFGTAWSGNSFNGNSGDGLYLQSNGTVNVASEEASSNTGTGIHILAAGGKGAVTVVGAASSDNGGDGVSIASQGNILLVYVSGEDNTSNGADLNNSTGSGTVTVKNVSFYDNEYGVKIQSNGTVTISSLAVGANRQSGLSISTNKAVIMTTLDCQDNALYGAHVVTSAAVTLNKATSGYNYFNGNGLSGLNIQSSGKVTVVNTMGSNNGTYEYDEESSSNVPATSAYGIEIHNTNAYFPQAVVLTDLFAGNNTLDGVFVETSGAVTATRLSASNNYHDGISFSQSGAFAIAISRVTANYNGWHGIFVDGLGNITLSKFTANNNSGDAGVTLDNKDGIGSVTILNPAGGATYNTANDNVTGVKIVSSGAITVTGLEMANNSGSGLIVDNTSSSTNAAITLNTVRSSSNGLRGISISSNGAIVVNNGWIHNNHYDGIYITSGASATIINTTSINNQWAGIYAVINSSGTLTLTNSCWYGNLKNSPEGYKNLMVFNGKTKIS